MGTSKIAENGQDTWVVEGQAFTFAVFATSSTKSGNTHLLKNEDKTSSPIVE